MPRAPKGSPKRPPGRPKGDTPPIPVTGFRVPPETLAALDDIAAELSQGAVRATRASVAVEALREFVERHRAKAAGAGARAPAPEGSPAPRAARKAST